jgi:hypothetical protein
VDPDKKRKWKKRIHSILGDVTDTCNDMRNDMCYVGPRRVCQGTSLFYKGHDACLNDPGIWLDSIYCRGTSNEKFSYFS